MRDALLNKVKGEDYIKNALRGSCFLNEDIFGPIPQKVQEKIDSFSNRSDSKLTQKSNFNKRSGDHLPRRGNAKRRGAVSHYNSPHSNYGSNFNTGYNFGYNYPSTSITNPNVSQVSQSPSLFHEKPQQKGSRGKNRRSRGRGSRH